MTRSTPSVGLARILDSIREQIDPEFEFLSPGTIPWTPAPSSLAETRVALVTTAGLHVKSDARFRTTEDPLGDTTFRIVPHGTWARELDLAAPYVDRRYVSRDPEVALPMRALERLYRDGRAGRPAPRHASFSAGIVRPLPGIEESAAKLGSLFAGDEVGAVILLPTCSICVQTVCLLAREIESRGLPTVAVTMLPELSEIVGAPRSLSVKFPFGAPCGDPDHRDLHREILIEAMELLRSCREPGVIRPSQQTWRRGSGAAPPDRPGSR